MVSTDNDASRLITNPVDLAGRQPSPSSRAIDSHGQRLWPTTAAAVAPYANVWHFVALLIFQQITKAYAMVASLKQLRTHFFFKKPWFLKTTVNNGRNTKIIVSKYWSKSAIFT